MRAFVAIDIPDEIRERIGALMDRLRRLPCDVRWSRLEGLHITLKFLGEISAERAEAVKAALLTLSAQHPARIAIAGAGCFPNVRTPRVIWLGVQAGPELAALAAGVEERLAPLKIPKEDRPFSPHLTLGRVRSPNGFRAIQELLKAQGEMAMGTFTASEFFLYESQPGVGGSIYTPIACFPFVQEPAPSADQAPA